MDRRKFLGLSFQTIVLLSSSNVVQAFNSSEYTLPPRKKIKLRFAIASDTHYGQPETPYEPMFDQMVGWLNNEKKQRGLDFSFINGDLIHNEKRHISTVKSKLDGLTMPYHVSHGNHDMMEEHEWQNVFNRPWHYSFEKDKVAFVVLNTADAGGKYICPDISWAEKELKRFAQAKTLFVFMHITPIKWTNASINCPELVSIFSQQDNLKAIFHGHDHDQDDVKEQLSKHYFFDAHIGGSWGTNYKGYRIVELLHSGEVITYQMNATENKIVNKNTLASKMQTA